MRRFNITVNGKTYEVGVEEVSGSAQPMVQQSAPPVQASVPVVQEQTPAPAQTAPIVTQSAPPPAGATNVTAPMPGNIIRVAVSVGDTVKEGDLLVILEAMKMENEILAPKSGTVAAISASKGSTVDSGAVLVSIS